MLPKFYLDRYQEFGQVVGQLQQLVSTPSLNPADFQAGCQQMQEIFQCQIASLTGEELADETVSLWQSSQTEIHRQLKLLETDWLFWQAARQPATAQKRQQAIAQRLAAIACYIGRITA